MTVGNKRGERAIVAGAGMGGLAAAAALSRYFDEIVIYEKDDLPETPEVRSGANQSGHVHLLLRGGASALEQLLPGLRADFLRAGAVDIDAGQDFRIFDFGCWRTPQPLGMNVLCMSRPAYEQVVRDRVRSLDNVSLRSSVKLEAIEFATGTAVSVAVDGERQSADLIVDTRGRGGPLPRELEAAGFGAPPETVIGIVMSYVSGRFKPPARDCRSCKGIMVRPQPPDRRYGIVSPVEGGEWIISLGGRGDLVPPMEIDGFLAYARDLAAPEFFDFIDGAELIGPLRRYKKPTANWRHYDRMEKFPKRLIPLGDTITSFNPTFGQGMTVAAKHALALSQSLSDNDVDDERLFRDYILEAMKASEAAWHLAGNADMEFPEVTGARPQDFEQTIAFGKGVKLLGNDDPDIYRMALEVFHMERSGACLQDESIAARVMAKLA